LAIVCETLAPGSAAQVVADRHGIGTGLIYTWRKQMLKAAKGKRRGGGIWRPIAGA